MWSYKKSLIKIFNQLIFPITYSVLVFISANTISGNKPTILTLTATSFITTFIFLKRIELKKIKIGMEQTHMWVSTFAVFVSLYFAKYIFENSRFALRNFDDRVIGTATLNGLDVSARTNTYVLILFVMIAGITIFLYLFGKVEAYTQKIDTQNHLDINKQFLFVFSLSAIFMQIFRYLNGASLFVSIQDLFTILSFSAFSIFVFTIYIYPRVTKGLKHLFSLDLYVLGFIFPLIIFFFRWIMLEGSYIFNYGYFLPYLVLLSLYWLILFLIPFKIKAYSLTKSFIPLSLIPLSTVMVNEVQYAFSSYVNIDVFLLSKIIAILLATVSVLIYFYDRNTKSKILLIENIFLPIFIFTVTLFSSHINIIEMQKGFDTFHHGENLLSLQQFVNFGKIPFIDLYPTHGLSYFASQLIYILLNGYTVVSPWLFEWIKTSIEILVLYYFLKKITSPIFASIIITFYPFLGIFGGKSLNYGYNSDFTITYYLLPLFIAAVFAWLIAKRTRVRLITLWLSVIAIGLWRIDFGIAAIISLVFLIIIEARNEEFRKSLPGFLKPTVIFFGGIFSIFIFTSILKSENPVNLLSLIIFFVKIQSQSQGLLSIAAGITQVSFWQYFILPAVSVFYIVYYIYVNFSVKKTNTTQLLLVFVAIISLVISIRSVQRQSLATIGYNPYLFGFLLATLPVFVKGKFTEKGAVATVAIIFIYQMFFPNYTTLIKEKRMVELRNWKWGESRVNGNTSQFKNLLNYLGNNLEGEQTFLDLTSSPLLYVYANKEFVNYLIPSAYITSDLIQEDSIRRINKFYEKGLLPFVIFRQKEYFANNIDGVPNELRSYKVYEYLYERYEPFGNIDGYQLWKAKDIEVLTQDIDTIIKVDQDFKLQLLPYYWAISEANTPVQEVVHTEKLNEKSQELVPGKPIKHSFNSNFSQSPSELLLTIKSVEKSNIVFTAGKDRISFETVPSSFEQRYTLRISTLYNLFSGNVNSFTLTSDKVVEIKGVEIRKIRK
jgi:hypothetical protein